MEENNPNEIPNTLSAMYKALSTPSNKNEGECSTDQSLESVDYHWTFISPFTVTLPVGSAISLEVFDLFRSHARLLGFSLTSLEGLLTVLTHVFTGLLSSIEQGTPVRIRIQPQRMDFSVSLTIIGHNVDFLKIMPPPAHLPMADLQTKDSWVRSLLSVWEPGHDMQGAKLFLSVVSPPNPNCTKD